MEKNCELNRIWNNDEREKWENEQSNGQGVPSSIPFWLAAIWARRSDRLSFRFRVPLQPGSFAGACSAATKSSSWKMPCLTSLKHLNTAPSWSRDVLLGGMLPANKMEHRKNLSATHWQRTNSFPRMIRPKSFPRKKIPGPKEKTHVKGTSEIFSFVKRRKMLECDESFWRPYREWDHRCPRGGRDSPRKRQAHCSAGKTPAWSLSSPGDETHRRWGAETWTEKFRAERKTTLDF